MPGYSLVPHLQDFHFVVRHRTGAANANADGLSLGSGQLLQVCQGSLPTHPLLIPYYLTFPTGPGQRLGGGSVTSVPVSHQRRPENRCRTPALPHCRLIGPSCSSSAGSIISPADLAEKGESWPPERLPLTSLSLFFTPADSSVWPDSHNRARARAHCTRTEEENTDHTSAPLHLFVTSVSINPPSGAITGTVLVVWYFTPWKYPPTPPYTHTHTTHTFKEKYLFTKCIKKFFKLLNHFSHYAYHCMFYNYYRQILDIIISDLFDH